MWTLYQIPMFVKSSHHLHVSQKHTIVCVNASLTCISEAHNRMCKRITYIYLRSTQSYVYTCNTCAYKHEKSHTLTTRAYIFNIPHQPHHGCTCMHMCVTVYISFPRYLCLCYFDGWSDRVRGGGDRGA